MRLPGEGRGVPGDSTEVIDEASDSADAVAAPGLLPPAGFPCHACRVPLAPAGNGPRLMAISDLRVAFPENRELTEDLRPRSEGHRLLLAGDVGEIFEGPP